MGRFIQQSFCFRQRMKEAHQIRLREELSLSLQLVPVAGWVASAFVKVYQLAAIRTSANGSTTMPRVGEVGEAINAVITFLKVLVVAIASMWPIVAVTLFTTGFRSLQYGSVLFTLLYAPAAFAILAKTGSIAEAVNPSNVVEFIRSLGSDYVIAFAALVFALSLGFFAVLGAAIVLRRIIVPSAECRAWDSALGTRHSALCLTQP